MLILMSGNKVQMLALDHSLHLMWQGQPHTEKESTCLLMAHFRTREQRGMPSRRGRCGARRHTCWQVTVLHLRTKYRYSHISPAQQEHFTEGPPFKTCSQTKRLLEKAQELPQLLSCNSCTKVLNLTDSTEEALPQTLFNVSCPIFSKLDYLIFQLTD